MPSTACRPPQVSLNQSKWPADRERGASFFTQDFQWADLPDDLQDGEVVVLAGEAAQRWSGDSITPCIHRVAPSQQGQVSHNTAMVKHPLLTLIPGSWIPTPHLGPVFEAGPGTHTAHITLLPPSPITVPLICHFFALNL